MDNGEITGLVFADLKKAFNTVDHSILCQKLEHYGVKNRELSGFKSYLSDRRQFCRANGVDYKIETIETGAPQGSLLNGHSDINNKGHIFRFRTINIEEIREAVGNVKAPKGFGIFGAALILFYPSKDEPVWNRYCQVCWSKIMAECAKRNQRVPIIGYIQKNYQGHTSKLQLKIMQKLYGKFRFFYKLYFFNSWL